MGAESTKWRLGKVLPLTKKEDARMKKYKRITAFYLACLLGVTMPVQNVWAKETSVLTSVEKSEAPVQEKTKTEQVKQSSSEEKATFEEKEQEKKTIYVVPELSALKEVATLLEKQYEEKMQTTETLFLKYFVQHVYSYIEQANEMLADYQNLLRDNPMEMQKNETIPTVFGLILNEKDTLLEQLQAFNKLQLIQEETLQITLTALEEAFAVLSTEQLLANVREEILQEMQYSNLPVQLHVQQTTYTCGMASVKMILDYLDITNERGYLYKENTLWNWANSNGQGTYVYRVAQTLTKYGVSYEYKHMSENKPSKTDKVTYYRDIIQVSLEKNKPVIAQIRPDKNEYWEYSSGHYILVKGMFVNKEGIWQIIINDCHYKYSAEDKVIPLTELIQSVEKHSSYMVVGK